MTQLTDITKEILCFWVGSYFLFWGLNGFFHGLPIPQNSAQFERFIEVLLRVPLLMTLVKLLEIGSGLMLVGVVGARRLLQMNHESLDWILILGLLFLFPIVAVIFVSHLALNFRRGWRVALQAGLPFFLLVVLVTLR